MTDEIAEDEPFAAFARWFELATKSEPLAETMTLATATRNGVPSVRAVLLKGFDQRGLVFYTNFESRKAARGVVLSLEVVAASGTGGGGGLCRVRRRSGCLFRLAAARQPDRRLGVGPVAP